MKTIEFTIPSAAKHSVSIQEDILPNFYHHLHRHHETQITLIIQGEGTLIAGNYTNRFKPGDLYIFGNDLPHVFKSDPEYFEKDSKKKVHALTIFFNPKGLFEPLLMVPEMTQVRNFLEISTSGLALENMLNDPIIKEMHDLKSFSDGLRLAFFIKFLNKLVNHQEWRQLSSVTTEHNTIASDGMRMNAIYQYTLQHFTDNISLQQIASIAHLTPQAFCRYFKKHTRHTFFGFLNELRIQEACKRLTNGNFDSISEVAYNTGFNSITNFNKVFKSITGKSPRAYIHTIRG